MSSPPSPSPARWFKLRRTRLGEPCLKTYTLECVDLLRRARVAFQAGRTLKEVFRLTQLEAVVRFLEEHECDFVEALARDLHKPRFETVLLELTVVKNEALHAINNLKKWMKPQHMERNLECFHVILSGVNDLPKVVELKFDHVFFSGNREDGSRIAQAAARTLTPVTLLLSGKNPCYVDQQCEIATTAQRIAWARFQNAGQSLVAPDYVLCHADVKAQLVEALKYYLMQFYGCDPRESCSYGRMVNLELFNRTRDMLWRSGKVVVGGQVIEAEKYIAPTILTEVTETDAIMQKEICGPVISRLMSETSSGSFCANDSILQSLMVALPFGGVGASGMGSYHGRYSFDTFSHRKSCLLRSTRFECVTYLRYPPYEDRNLSLMTWASTVSQKSQGWCQIL
ncbi:Aldehyde dehydrogenase family 3 member B1 [Nibea albiflora]|uniref:Aldehyde dehydrogenase family 3 member B1 n=1 Tax=Nibea albiflora TaxID=240163 RepID=A0ACB7FC35_NIBAL|nr:Aldehyde dehydrogenase family 3 member B1 [Nibea albiflora]